MRAVRKYLVIMTALIATGACFSARAEWPGLAGDATYAGAYIWRGIPVNEESVFQPSATISGSGFAMSVWGSMDLTDWGEEAGYGDKSGEFTEFDYTASYDASIKKFKFGSGFVTYTFPHQDKLLVTSTCEAFLRASLEVPSSPTLTAFLDVDEHEHGGSGSYVSLDLSHTFKLTDRLGLGLAGHAALANQRFFAAYYGINVDHGFNDWSATASLPITLPRGFSVTPKYMYTSLLQEQVRETVRHDWDRHPDADVFLLSVDWAGPVK